MEFAHYSRENKNCSFSDWCSIQTLKNEYDKGRFLCVWCHRLESRAEFDDMKDKNLEKWINDTDDPSVVMTDLNSAPCKGMLCKGSRRTLVKFYIRKRNDKPHKKCKRCMAYEYRLNRTDMINFGYAKKLEIGSCAECHIKVTSKTLCCFDFDHIDPSTKLGTVSSMISMRKDRNMILNEINKCRLLCCKCHTLHTRTQQGYIDYTKYNFEESDISIIDDYLNSDNSEMPFKIVVNNKISLPSIPDSIALPKIELPSIEILQSNNGTSNAKSVMSDDSPQLNNYSTKRDSNANVGNVSVSAISYVEEPLNIIKSGRPPPKLNIIDVNNLHKIDTFEANDLPPENNIVLSDRPNNGDQIENTQPSIDQDIIQPKLKIVSKNRISKKCLDCGITINREAQRCVKCCCINRRKCERPPLETLLADVKELGYVGTGRKYSVSDNAIRKWIKAAQKIIVEND